MGERRDWTSFAAEYPKYRMNDDREVRCYALLVTHLREGASALLGLAEEVRRNWLRQREPEDGCTLAASTLIADGQGPRRMTANDAWHKARLAMEANRPWEVAAAVEIAAPEAVRLLAELNNSPAKFLTSRVTVASKMRKEMISLALIKLAASDADNAASQLENKWGPQLSPEERNWVWGVIGKQAAQRLGNDALAYYGKVSRDSDLTDDMLVWKARAAIRLGQWPVLLQAANAMSDDARKEPAWVYWKARAWPPMAATNRRAGPAAVRIDRLCARLLRAAGARRAGPESRHPGAAGAADRRGKGSGPAPPRTARALTPSPSGCAPRACANGTTPPTWRVPAACPIASCWRRRNSPATARSGTAASTPASAPAPTSTWNSASRCPFATPCCEQPRNQPGPGLRLRPDPPGKPVHHGRPLACGRLRPDAGDAGHRALDGRRIGLNGFAVEQLNDRDTNIAIGTGYLKLVLDDFAGSMPLAAAAYNAGPGRPRTGATAR